MAVLKIPKVGEYVRHIGKLIAVNVVPPPPPTEPEREYIFEEIEARCELRLNGEVIKGLATLSDFYGLETSVSEAIKEMKVYANKRNITKDSDLEVVVVKIVHQYRKQPLNRENFWNKEYRDFDTFGDYRTTKGLPEPIETVVWSSKDNA